MGTMGSSPWKQANRGSSASPFFSSSCVTCCGPEAPCWYPDFVVKGSSKSQMCLRRIMATILHHSKQIPELSMARSLTFASKQTEAGASTVFPELKPSEARVPAAKLESVCRSVDLNLTLGPPDTGKAPENSLVNGDSACSGVRGGVECRGKDCGSSVESVNGFVSRRSESEGECNPKGVGDLATVASNSEKVEVSDIIDGCAEAARSADGSRHSFGGHTDGITLEDNSRKEKGNDEVGENDNNAECYSACPATCNKDEAMPSQQLPTPVAGKAAAADEGYLGLLIEAVQLVSGDVFGTERHDDSTDPPSGRKAPEKDSSAAPGSPSRRNSRKRPSAPVVRSKHGRNQTLPSRYCDSVLDPWKRFPLHKLGAVRNRSAKRSF
ncbi:unnamed protein product [Victoria cruziana]